VLLVDDEPLVLRATTALLRALGFGVIQARDGAEALAAFEEHADEVRCVILDRKMPVLDGEETFRALRRLRDDTPVLMATGFADIETTRVLESEGLAGVLRKPFTIDALRAALQRLL
jgi:CheY-like chemotaxis protein